MGCCTSATMEDLTFEARVYRERVASVARLSHESIPFLVEILERPRCSPHALRVPSTRSAFPLLACSAARNCGRGQ